MREMRMKWVLILWAVCGFSVAMGQEDAPRPLEIISSEPCRISLLKWHERENGWLITCRLEVATSGLVKPAAYLELRGYEPVKEKEEGEKAAAEESDSVVKAAWTEKQVVRRKDFDKKVGSRDANFVRFLLSAGIPANTERLELEFFNEPYSE